LRPLDANGSKLRAVELRQALSDYRAERLCSPRSRHRLAESIRDAIERSALPRSATWSAAVPIATASVRANSGLLLALAARLDSDAPVAARGVSEVRALLTYGSSPLYGEGGDAIELQDAVESALISLGD
jgi:hypothetical protein